MASRPRQVAFYAATNEATAAALRLDEQRRVTRALEQDVASVRIAHCSWCLAECAHAQVSEGFLLFRAAYRCGGCARRTLPCRRSGCAAHARGDAGKDDDLCIVHRAVVPAWPSGTDTKYDAWLVDRLHPKARCSWCLDVKRHSLGGIQSAKRLVRTHLRRPSYSCTRASVFRLRRVGFRERALRVPPPWSGCSVCSVPRAWLHPTVSLFAKLYIYSLKNQT